jgi:hypothetical protein
MAILSDVPIESVRTVIERIDERLVREATEPEAARLMSSTLLLSGLRFPKGTLAPLFFGVRTMALLSAKIIRDSSGYEFLKEMLGDDMEKQIRIEEARSILVNLATRRFGDPDEPQKASLDGIADHDRLVRLCENVGSVSTWDELLAAE